MGREERAQRFLLKTSQNQTRAEGNEDKEQRHSRVTEAAAKGGLEGRDCDLHIRPVMTSEGVLSRQGALYSQITGREGTMWRKHSMCATKN